VLESAATKSWKETGVSGQVSLQAHEVGAAVV
jgi:hypothetical protein